MVYEISSKYAFKAIIKYQYHTVINALLHLQLGPISITAARCVALRGVAWRDVASDSAI